ncbi:hypothetical protein AX16_011029 [Volvariella volvacea WC 439]|nr:hypothetical protein AX16_011029 [Volvariella volvacea WC 439]
MNLDTVVSVLKLLPLPILSFLYLAFCWVVQYRVVPVPVSRFIDTSTDNFTTVKSVVTSVNIVIIGLALQPIRSLIADLRGEEFVRVLKLQDRNKRLTVATANSLSSTSLGIWKTIPILISRSCSIWFVVAFIFGFIAKATSSLVPAALSVHDVVVDSYNTTFEVAAIPALSVNSLQYIYRNPIYRQRLLTNEMWSRLQHSASLVWAEGILNVNYSFSSSDPQYLIPLPTNLSYDISTKWITDAFVMHPWCDWQSSDIRIPTELSVSQTLDLAGTLPKLNISFNATFGPAQIDEHRNYFMYYVSAFDGEFMIFNTASEDVPEGGYSVWILIHFPEIDTPLSFDLTGIPIVEGFDAEETKWHMAALACSPNITIETVEAQNNGRDITVLRSLSHNSQDSLPGNLDWRESDFFFPALFDELSRPATPFIVGRRGTSTPVQIGLVVGWDQLESIDTYNYNSGDKVVLRPMPTPNITAMYSNFLQSAAKPYLTGILGNKTLPGIIRSPTLVFTASRAYAITSTVLLAILNVLNIWAFFRSQKGEVFSLFTVSSIMDGSNVPGEVTRFREDKPTEGTKLEREFEDEYRNRYITLDHNASDGGRALTVHEEGTYPLH